MSNWTVPIPEIESQSPSMDGSDSVIAKKVLMAMQLVVRGVEWRDYSVKIRFRGRELLRGFEAKEIKVEAAPWANRAEKSEG